MNKEKVPPLLGLTCNGNPLSTDTTSWRMQVRELELKNQQMRNKSVCRICKSVKLTDSCVTFLKCGHAICCEGCAELIDNCIACGQVVLGTVRTFRL